MAGIYKAAVNKVGRGNEFEVEIRFTAIVSHCLFEAAFA